MTLSLIYFLVYFCCSFFCFFFLMIRRPPRSTLFPTRRSSDLLKGIAGRKVRALLTAIAIVLGVAMIRSEEHTSELQSRRDLVCRLLLEKKKKKQKKKQKIKQTTT